MIEIIELALTGLIVIVLLAGYSHAIGRSKRVQFSSKQAVKNYLAQTAPHLRPIHILRSGAGHHALVRYTDTQGSDEAPPHTVLLYAMGRHWNSQTLTPHSIRSLEQTQHTGRVLIRFHGFTTARLVVKLKSHKQTQDWVLALTPFMSASPTTTEGHHV